MQLVESFGMKLQYLQHADLQWTLGYPQGAHPGSYIDELGKGCAQIGFIASSVWCAQEQDSPQAGQKLICEIESVDECLQTWTQQFVTQRVAPGLNYLFSNDSTKAMTDEDDGSLFVLLYRKYDPDCGDSHSVSPSCV